jgi:pyruvate formate lyase activating enzyme
MPADSGGAIIGEQARAAEIVAAAEAGGCRSISYTYTEPTVFFEFALETAILARAKGIRNIFVTNGYMTREALEMISPWLDAANVDLKAFTERFYRQVCGAELAPVLDTLVYLKRETRVWLEITTLLIPGENDSDAELDAMTRWIAGELGPDVPLHFSAFHPDWKMTDRPPTPPATLTRARELAMRNGLRYVYTGNVHDRAGGSTWCNGCGALLIERDWYELGRWGLTPAGDCARCGLRLPGVFAERPGRWGGRRLPVRLHRH